LQLQVNSPALSTPPLEVGSAAEIIESFGSGGDPETPRTHLWASAFSEKPGQAAFRLEAGNVPELLSLQAGVTYTGNRPGISIKTTDTRSGSREWCAQRSKQQSRWMAWDVNADTKGYAFTSVLPITQDSVAGVFRVTTTNYNADEGRSSGAQVAAG